MKYLIILFVVIISGCNPNYVYEGVWVCKDGYNLGGMNGFGDEIGFCKKDCGDGIYNLTIDDNSNIYLNQVKVGKVIKCNSRELIITSMNGSEEGYYMFNGKKNQ